MKRYLSGGGSLVLKMDVSVWSVLSKARAAGALRMRSCDAPADTVSRDSASAVKPGKKKQKTFVVTLHVCKSDNLSQISSVRCYLGSPGLFAICLGLLGGYLAWPQCQHSDGDNPEQGRDKAAENHFLSVLSVNFYNLL